MAKTGYLLLALSLSFLISYPAAGNFWWGEPFSGPYTETIDGVPVNYGGEDDDGIVGDICPRFDFNQSTWVVYGQPITYSPYDIVPSVQVIYFSNPYHEFCLMHAGLLTPRDEDFAYDQGEFEDLYEDKVGSSSSLSTFEFFETQASTYKLLNIQTCFDDNPNDDEDVSLEGFFAKMVRTVVHHRYEASLGVSSEFGERLKPILEVDLPREDIVNQILNELSSAISALHNDYADIYLAYANSALIVRDKLCNESD